MRTLSERVLACGPSQVYRAMARGPRLCVLAYHGVSHPRRFQAHLDWLDRHAHVVSLDLVMAAATADRPLPERAVLLTFDDGERTVLEHALPLLRARRMPAVAFVVAGLIGTDRPFWWVEAAELARRCCAGRSPDEFVRHLKQVPDADRRMELAKLRRESGMTVRTPQLTRDDVRRLLDGGISVQNHSMTHPCLDRCADETLVVEVHEARALLAELAGEAPSAFAYPNGNWDERARHEVARSGHVLGFGFDHRLARLPVADPLTISRVRVDSDASVERLTGLVSGLHSRIHQWRRTP